MTTDTAHHEAHSEKQHAALSSLFWALFLTLIKLGAGLATNRLGLLSEALHSRLDLVAAGITFFAVRVAARPADETHPYGYGKIENLSALAETVLLLVTCGGLALISQAVPAAMELLMGAGAAASGAASAGAGASGAAAAGAGVRAALPEAEARMLATAAMGSVSAMNGLGRLINGFIWDKFGYRVCLTWIAVAFAAGMLC